MIIIAGVSGVNEIVQKPLFVNRHFSRQTLAQRDTCTVRYAWTWLSINKNQQEEKDQHHHHIQATEQIVTEIILIVHAAHKNIQWNFRYLFKLNCECECDHNKSRKILGPPEEETIDRYFGVKKAIRPHSSTLVYNFGRDIEQFSSLFNTKNTHTLTEAIYRLYMDPFI